MATETTLEKVKKALRISVNGYDSELTDLIAASKIDLEIAGVEETSVVETDALIIRAIITYCKLNFGAPGDYGDYNLLKGSYDEQKRQLHTSSDYNGRD